MHTVIRGAVVPAATLMVIAGTTARAVADEGASCDPFLHQCKVEVRSSDRPPTRETEGRNGGGRSSRGNTPTSPSLRDLCVTRLADPQPPASDPVWAGRDPGAGRVFVRTCPITKEGGVTGLLFVADETQSEVSAEGLARGALATLQVPSPVLQRSPGGASGAGGVGFTWVNAWTWVWTAPQRWRALSRTASAGAVEATVTVRPVRLVFDPGDGSRPVECAGPGRAWRPVDGDAAPSGGGCGFRYRQVTSRGPVTTTLSIRWRVTWAGSGGAGGVLPDLVTGTATALDVRQLQAVIE